jgi:hypothetical protein
MQNITHLHRPTHVAALDIHYGKSETTLVTGEAYVAWNASQRQGIRVPDLLIAFGVDRAGITERNGYAIEREGKPPDFALEVASRTTGFADYTEKRRDYERYGITEYWRFDSTGGQYHDVALAGDRLIDGRYHPVAVEWSDDSHCRGYSEVLGLFLCWEEGYLRWYDPKTGSYLPTLDEEVARADRETARANREAAARQVEAARADREAAARQAEAARANREVAARIAAEARARELEEELERLRGQRG